MNNFVRFFIDIYKLGKIFGWIKCCDLGFSKYGNRSYVVMLLMCGIFFGNCY